MHNYDMGERPIDVTERSGVLVPSNLERFAARWSPPVGSIADVVDTYWAVEWNMASNEQVTQRILEFPAITVSIESGDVPAPFMITGVQRSAWVRTIRGTGTVFAIRLRPAGLAAISSLTASNLPAQTPLERGMDATLFDMMSAIAEAEDPATRADEVIAEARATTPPSHEHLLANAVVDTLSRTVRSRTGSRLAAEVGASERAVQRALQSTLGMGPKAVARRIRLQEVVRQLSIPGVDVSDIAVCLGYADQAHLIRDFRGVAGVTPGQYVRENSSSEREDRS